MVSLLFNLGILIRGRASNALPEFQAFLFLLYLFLFSFFVFLLLSRFYGEVYQQDLLVHFHYDVKLHE